MGDKKLTDQQPAAAPGRPSRVRYQVLALACSAAFLAYVHRVGFAVALPKVGQTLGLGPEGRSYLMAAFLLAYGGFEIPGGWLSDRFGVRRVLTFLVLGWSLATGGVALVGWVPTWWLLPFLFVLTLRFLFGAFQAGGFPSLARLTADWMPLDSRASAQGMIWMSSRGGAMVVPLLLGALIWLLGGWQLPLWLITGLGVAWCALFWSWFHNRPAEMPQVNDAERALIAAGRTGAPAAHGAVPWGRLLRCRSVWALCLLYGFGGFAANFYVTLLPDYLVSVRHLPERQKDLFTSLPFAAGAVTCLLGGLISDRLIRRTGNRKWGRRLVGAVGLAAGTLGWLALNRAANPWVLAGLLVFIFACNDLSMGPAWAACADIGERYAGTVGGTMNMMANLLGAVGNLLAGWLWGLHHPEWVFVVYGCAFAVASCCWLAVDVTKGIGEKA